MKDRLKRNVHKKSNAFFISPHEIAITKSLFHRKGHGYAFIMSTLFYYKLEFQLNLFLPVQFARTNIERSNTSKVAMGIPPYDRR